MEEFLKAISPWADFITVISLFFAGVGFLFGVRVYRRQMNAQLFMEFTRRFGEIMNEFPTNAQQSRFDLLAVPPEKSDALTTAILKYLNLCSEEFYLWKRGYLSKDMWNIWSDELQRTVRSDLVRKEWELLRKEFEVFPEFVRFIEEAQAKNSH